jgi:GNAT superfamily N-acetyltransferase
MITSDSGGFAVRAANSCLPARPERPSSGITEGRWERSDRVQRKLYHVGVLPEYRGRGIAKRMIARSTDALKAAGIKTAFLLTSTADAASFWQANGWSVAAGIVYHSRIL